MPKVSVIIPVYNVEKYLRECLDSVINQTLKDIEIICVDDGSTDNSGRILDEYAAKDNRIKVIHKENGGYGKAMNVGLDNATGEYIGIVEPDDYVELDMYETLYNKAIENDVDFIKGDLYYWWSVYNTRKYITCIGDNALYGIVQNDFSNPRLSVSTVANWAGIYRRNFINKYNIRHLETPGASYQDQGFYYKVIFNAKSAYFVNHAFYHYRQDNISSSINNKNKIYCIFDEYEEIEKYLANIESKEKFYQVVFRKKYNSCCWNYGRINSNLKPLFYSRLCSEFANGYYEGKISRCNFSRQQWATIQTWVKDFEKINDRPEPLTFNKIPIALASDKNYAPQMYVTLVSILENKNYNTFYDFYLLVPKDFPNHIKQKFKELQNKYYHSKITFLDMNDEFKNQKMHISHITIPTYYRLKLANLLPTYSKVLYLDVDTCVCADLFELYNIDLKSNYIAGVPAAGYYFNEEVHCKRLNIPSMKNYVNAGVLLMNLNKMREDSLTNKFIDLTKNDYSSQDQDIINVACYGHIKIIPLKYNFMTKYMDNFIKCEKDIISYNIEIYDRNEVIEALEHPIIIHYADKIKPWDDKSAYKASFWWEYAKQCPYNFEINSSLWRYIFSVCNNSTKSHKIITICGVKVKIKRNVLQSIFTVRNEYVHKVITILGLQFKFKSKKLIERMKFNNIENQLNNIRMQFDSFTSEIQKITSDYNRKLQDQKKIYENRLNLQRKELLYKLHKYCAPEMRPIALKDWFCEITGSELNLDKPKTFNEKIQWMKLYDSTPEKTRLADKYLVREWVKEKIGEEYLIPLLGVWDNFDEINFDELPKQFVLKCNHGCGYNIIVKDKFKLDIEDTRKKINKWMNEDFAFKFGFEMHYSPIPRKIIAEKYIENDNNDLYDYKFWCFNGAVKYIQFLSERNTDGLKMAFYDRDWNKQDFVYTYPLDTKNIVKPDNLDIMIELAEKLANGMKHVRVDFYRLNDGKIYFGEMIFTSCSGISKWQPKEIDAYLGSMLQLPNTAKRI